MTANGDEPVQASPSPTRSALIPYWFVGAVISFFALFAMTLGIEETLAPVLAMHVTVQGLPEMERALLLLLYGSAVIAGTLGGVAIHVRTKADASKSALRKALSATGAIVIVGVLLAVVAYGLRETVKPTTTVANLLLMVIGTVLAITILHWRHGGQPGRRRAGRRQRVTGAAGVGLILVLPCGTIASRVAPTRSVNLLTSGVTISPNDISPGNCIVSSLSGSLSGQATLFSVELGPDFSFEVNNMGDHTETLSTTVGATGGLNVSFGDGLFTDSSSALLSSFDSGLNFSTTGLITVNESNNYNLTNRSIISRVLGQSLSRDIEASVGYPLVANAVVGMTKTVTLIPSLHLPPPAAIGYGVSGQLGIVANAAVVLSESVNLNAGGGIQALLTVPSGANPNNVDALLRSATELQVTFDLNGALSGMANWGLVGVNGQGTVTGSLTANFSKIDGAWVPTSASLETTGQVNSNLLSLLQSGQSAGSELLKTLSALSGADFGLSSGMAVHLTATVNFVSTPGGPSGHPEVLAALVNYIEAVEAYRNNSHSASSTVALSQTSTVLESELEADSIFTAEAYRVTEGNSAANLTLGDGVTVSLGTTGSLTEEKLAEAAYGTESSGMLPSVGCRP